MGLFSNKDNPFLPVAKNKEYTEYRFPNTGEMMMINLGWLEKCMKNAKSGEAIWKSDYPSTMAEHYLASEEKFLKRIVSRVNGIPKMILEKIEEKSNQKNIDLIYSELLRGGAFAIIEIMSQLQINGLVHPSIHNAICLSRMGLKIENQNLSFGASKSLEVGYGLVRYEGEPIEKFITNLHKLQGS
jgi:hypothetical protein